MDLLSLQKLLAAILLQKKSTMQELKPIPTDNLTKYKIKMKNKPNNVDVRFICHFMQELEVNVLMRLSLVKIACECFLP